MNGLNGTLDRLTLYVGFALLGATIMKGYHAVTIPIIQESISEVVYQGQSIDPRRKAQNGWVPRVCVPLDIPPTPLIIKLTNQPVIQLANQPIKPPLVQETYPDPFTTDPEFINDDDRMLLTRMIIGEKSIDNDNAIIAAAYTVLNRVKDGRYGKEIREVLVEGYTCFKGDKSEMMDPYDRKSGDVNEWNQRKWQRWYDMVGDVLKGKVPDTSKGGVSYADVIEGDGPEETWLLANGQKQKRWMHDEEFIRVERIKSNPYGEMWVYTRNGKK